MHELVRLWRACAQSIISSDTAAAERSLHPSRLNLRGNCQMWAAFALNTTGGTLDYCLLAGLLNDKRASRGAPASAKEVDRLQRLPGLAAGSRHAR